MSAAKASSSFAEAWKVLYRARTLFAAFLILAMILDVAVFLTVRFSGTLDPLIQFGRLTAPMGGFENAPGEGPSPASSASVDVSSLSKARQREGQFRSVMFFAAVLAVVGVTFMALCAVLAVMVLVAGNLPGAGAATGSFFYAAGAALWLLLPWGQILGYGTSLPVGVPTFTQLLTAYQVTMDPSAGWDAQIGLWVRHVVYPAVIFLLTIAYLLRTSQAQAQMSAGTVAEELNLPRPGRP